MGFLVMTYHRAKAPRLRAEPGLVFVIKCGHTAGEDTGGAGVGQVHLYYSACSSSGRVV